MNHVLEISAEFADGEDSQGMTFSLLLAETLPLQPLYPEHCPDTAIASLQCWLSLCQILQ